MALAAGTLFAVNGTVSKVILESGISVAAADRGALHGALHRARSQSSLLTRPESAPHRPARARLPRRLRRLRRRARPALLLPRDPPARDRRLAPDPVPRAAARRAVRALRVEGARPPAALGGARRSRSVGLTLVVDLWHGVSLDGLGVVFSLLSAVTFAGLHAPRRARGRQARPDLAPLLRASSSRAIFWAIVQPWWSFPFDVPGNSGLAARQPLATCTCRSGC